MSNARNLANLLNSSGVLTADAGLKADNITIDGTEIDLSSGDLTLDVSGDIILDADDGDIQFKNGGTLFGSINSDASSPQAMRIQSHVSNGDIIFKGNDGGSTITAMQIDMSAGGNVGIGCSPVSKLHISGNLTIDNSSNAPFIDFVENGDTGDSKARISMDQVSGTAGQLIFSTENSGTLAEAMRLTASGQLLLNTTSTTVNSNSGRIITINKGNMAALHVGADSTSSSTGVIFSNPNGTVGSVTMSGSGTSFNTSSDYRLKENVVTDWDATSRLKQLKPSRFNFKTDKKTTMDGFLAHEVSSIVPEAISGDKDETQDVGTIKDKDGNVLQENVLESEKKDGQTWTKTETQNVYQGIDQSKLVPLLVKTVQELEARLTALESK